MNACPHGISGYSLMTSLGWHWEIPEDLHDRATLNTLEFLSCYIGVYMEHAVGGMEPLEVVLAQTSQ
jgi:hypothetical protein